MPMRLRSRRALRRTFMRLVFLVALLGAAGAGVHAAQLDQAAEGGKLFQQYCLGCHTIGEGKRVGPDLKDVTTLRDSQWLVSWITGPDKMLASGDPIAKEIVAQFPGVMMPNLGLTAPQAELILAYIAAQSGTTAPAATPEVAALPPGDVARGKDYFTGRTGLSGGGPPCMACHSVNGMGALGGGQLGPDLTNSVAKYGGDAGISAFLANPPTKTMNVVWTGRPLTAQENADLVAYLTQAPMTNRATNAIVKLSALALAGAVLFLALAQLTWRHRLKGVRRPMVMGKRR